LSSAQALPSAQANCSKLPKGQIGILEFMLTDEDKLGWVVTQGDNIPDPGPKALSKSDVIKKFFPGATTAEKASEQLLTKIREVSQPAAQALDEVGMVGVHSPA
jgi:hypothetical protein